MSQTTPLSLFERFPRTATLPLAGIASLPTPMTDLSHLLDGLDVHSLWVKRDDLTNAVYGGNKVRKLEFLLGDALRRNAKEVVTFGFAGSNHALATAIYARRLGLGCTSLLLPQVNAHYVRRNLLAGQHFGADLRHFENWTLLGIGLARTLLLGGIRQRVLPRIIPAGGSCPLGILGYVNAAFELKEQIGAAKMPEPDIIYVPLGSMGTSVGLELGLRAAGLRSRVVAVRVIEERYARLKKHRQLFSDTVSLLRRADASFPRLNISDDGVEIRNDCLGDGYARFTAKAVRAAALMKEKAGIVLNGTYSAKAFSALVGDAAGGLLKGKTVLFWNTYNSRDLSSSAAGVDYRRLPRAFHRYFEEDVQPLDRDGFDR